MHWMKRRCCNNDPHNTRNRKKKQKKTERIAEDTVFFAASMGHTSSVKLLIHTQMANATSGHESFTYILRTLSSVHTVKAQRNN